MIRQRLVVTLMGCLGLFLGLALVQAQPAAPTVDCTTLKCSFMPMLLKAGTGGPAATATQAASPTIPAPSATLTPTATLAASPTQAATATAPTVTASPAPSATADPTATPPATIPPTETATATSTSTSTATSTSTSTSTATGTSTATSTATATGTAVASATTVPGFTQITWVTAAPTPPRYPFSASEAQGLVVNNKLYVFGGFGDPNLPGGTPSRRFYVYDPVNNPSAWTRLPDVVQGVTHAGTATDGRYIYWVGGYRENLDGNGNPNGQIFGARAARWFDTTSKLSGTLPLLPVPRAAGGLALVGHKLHYVGGTNIERNQDVGDHYVLDLNNQAAGWTSAAALPNPRHHAGIVELGGLIYFIGGQHKHDGQLIPQNDVHRYDPATDTWTQMADLPILPGLNHISHATIALDGRILVFGGQTTHNSPVNTVFVYDPATDAWTQLNAMPASRFSGVAGEINGAVYYATGAGGSLDWRNTYKGLIVRP